MEASCGTFQVTNETATVHLHFELEPLEKAEKDRWQSPITPVLCGHYPFY